MKDQSRHVRRFCPGCWHPFPLMSIKYTDNSALLSSKDHPAPVKVLKSDNEWSMLLIIGAIVSAAFSHITVSRIDLFTFEVAI